MGSLKKELFFHFNTKNWDVSHFASEKYQLELKNESPQINFEVSDNKNLLLSGKINLKEEKINFEFDEQSPWLSKTDKTKTIELLDHLFFFMESQVSLV